MGRFQNPLNWGSGFNITAAQPFDSRVVVATQTDLTTASTWEDVGLYNGLVVSIQDTGKIFVLKDKDTVTDSASWIAVGGDVSADLSALSDKVGTLEGTVTNLGNIEYYIATKEVATDSITEEPLWAKSYVLYKKTSADTSPSVVGEEINIPKDMVVSSAKVVTGEDGKQDIVLTIANGEDIKIDAEALVDVYTVAEDSADYLTITNNTLNVNLGGLTAGLGLDSLQTDFAGVSELVGDHNTGIAANSQAIAELSEEVAISHAVNGIIFQKNSAKNLYEAVIAATSIAIGEPVTHIVTNEDGSTEEVHTYDGTDSLFSVVVDLDKRIKTLTADLDSATAGGINSIVAGSGIAVTSEGVNDRKIAVSLSTNEDNQLQVVEGKLYVAPTVMTWEQLN